MDAEATRNGLVDRLREREDLAPETEAALRAVPRHEFVPAERRSAAYEDSPLPIGEGQTISAPHMVAIMTELLDLEPGLDVLEIGTGCGYHAAVTAGVVGPEHVYSVEYHDSLAHKARKTLEGLGYGGISIRAGDGKEGWRQHAPYDRVYLTCAAEDFPDAVVEQVRPGGILLGPLRTGAASLGGQVLVRATRESDGGLSRERHGGVRFVPLK